MKIGIDLGTTNSALAYIDEREAEDRDFPPLHIFETPQLVAAGRVEARRTLPSFLYLEEGQPVGVYAREQGALVPTRLVHSAKSWLSNPDVDRTAKILPWDSQETGRVLSPVEVSARILAKFREEWDRAQGAPLAEQDIVLTVPASFDEEARELTVMAARDAGIERLTLLEEPAAAFYSWIANNLAQSRKKLFDGQTVLVCDVGGGTSDFRSERAPAAARRAGRGLLFLDREQPGAVAEEAFRRPDGAGLRRGRRHQRLQPDSRFARWRPHQLHPHRGGEAPAAGRRQPGSDAGLAGGDQARREAFHPPAQRPAAPVLGRQGKAAQRSRFASGRDHRARLRLVADRQIAAQRNPARGGAGAGAGRLSAIHRTRRSAPGGCPQPVPRARSALRFRCGHPPPLERFPGAAGGAAGRHSVQRRVFHSGDFARSRG